MSQELASETPLRAPYQIIATAAIIKSCPLHKDCQRGELTIKGRVQGSPSPRGAQLLVKKHCSTQISRAKGTTIVIL